MGVVEAWLGAFADIVAFVLFEESGEEEIGSINRPLGFSSSSSSEERTATRFRRFAGGAMASRLVVRVLPQSMFVWRARG